VVAHALIPNTWEAEESGFFSSRPPWSTECLPGQPGVHRKSQSSKTKITKNKNKYKNKRMKQTIQQPNKNTQKKKKERGKK
jgi:hypothetical protein